MRCSCINTGRKPSTLFGEIIMQARIMTFLSKLKSDRAGATAIEYGLIAALVALTIVGILTTIGDQVLGYFMEVNSGFIPK